MQTNTLALVTFEVPCAFAATGHPVTVHDIPPLPSLLTGTVILNAAAPADVVHNYLISIRNAAESRLLPVFITAELPQEMSLLADGVTTTAAEAALRAERIRQRVEGLPDDKDADDERALLAYLHSRQVELVPVKAPCAPRYYRYPLAEAFCTSGPTADVLIAQLLHRGLLARATLVDRVRVCPQCAVAQVNYVDVCPTCNSIDMVKLPFLHCFTCGHVAPQEAFIAASGLRCPNCRTNLRHIGADYDRPLESYHCNACHASFIEPRIVARCMACDRVADPEDLEAHTVHSLVLSEKGRTAIRTGNVDDIYALLDELRYVSPQFFEQQLGWMLQMARRYPDEAFSVIGIRLHNVPELVMRLGRQTTHELLETFAGRLRQLVRTTDLATRTAEDTLWLLLPRTGAEGCAILHGRIVALGEDTRRPDGTRLDFGTYRHTEDGSRPADEEARLVIAQYTSELGDKG